MPITFFKNTSTIGQFKLTKKVFLLLGVVIWSLSANGANVILNLKNKNTTVSSGVKRPSLISISSPGNKDTLTLKKASSPAAIESATIITVGGKSNSQTIIKNL